MKTYQYDNTGEILAELGNIRRLLEVIAGVKSLEKYLEEETSSLWGEDCSIM